MDRRIWDGGRERKREKGSEGGRKRGREAGRERKRGREGGREGDRERSREGEMEIVGKKKGKGSFYIAQYPVRWTAQSASHFLRQTCLF